MSIHDKPFLAEDLWEGAKEFSSVVKKVVKKKSLSLINRISDCLKVWFGEIYQMIKTQKDAIGDCFDIKKVFDQWDKESSKNGFDWN